MITRLHPDADAEMLAAAQWYEDRVTGLGQRFLSEVIDALSEIERHPQRFARVQYRSPREIRRCMLAHFPYGVVLP
jgi:toxin ParE1/3/4